MSLFNIFSNQLSKVIEWKDQDQNLIWYKFPAKRDEIINASKLILTPGQGCVLVYEGKIEDIITESGIYNLKTDNHPFLTTLSNLRQNFDSEHKLYLFFFRTADVLNQSWGTAQPIKYMDPKYKLPVEIGLHGVFSYSLDNAEHFYRHIAGNIDTMDTSYIREILINVIVQEIITAIANARLSYNEIDSNLNTLALSLKERISAQFTNLGLTLKDFKISGTQFDVATQGRIGSIADITAQNQAANEAGLSYVELEKLRALRDAAKNEGGLAGIGAQLGAGLEIGKQFNEQKNEVTSHILQEDDFAGKLQKLNLLLKEEIITQTEFDQLKAQILSKI